MNPQSERRLSASIASHVSWANTTNRTARTAAGRAALDQKFLDEAGGDPERAEHLRKAYFQRLALRSVQARRRGARGAIPSSVLPEAMTDPGEDEV